MKERKNATSSSEEMKMEALTGHYEMVGHACRALRHWYDTASDLYDTVLRIRNLVKWGSPVRISLIMGALNRQSEKIIEAEGSASGTWEDFLSYHVSSKFVEFIESAKIPVFKHHCEMLHKVCFQVRFWRDAVKRLNHFLFDLLEMNSCKVPVKKEKFLADATDLIGDLHGYFFSMDNDHALGEFMSQFREEGNTEHLDLDDLPF